MNRTIGTCSLCQGPVIVPSIWGGIHPPVPTCARCGAVPKQPHGPVIPMERPKVTTPLIPAVVQAELAQTLQAVEEHWQYLAEHPEDEGVRGTLDALQHNLPGMHYAATCETVVE